MTTKTRYSSLSARLIVSMLLIIFVPSFIGLAILGMKTRDDFRQQAITHLRDGLEIKTVNATNRLDRSVASLRLTTTRVKKELAATPGLALRLSLGEAPKEWYDDKLYRKLYTVLKNEILKHSGITEARIINSSGNELIRLVQTPSGVEEKAPGELKNKAHRKYFKNTMSLPGGGVHIHPISLQKEHKKIIRPLMPVLRIGGKVTLADEVNFGIVIFNIRSEYIFGLRTSQKGSGFMVTDENGYFLVHPDENALWGNELGHSANLFNIEPEFGEDIALKEALLKLDTGIQRSQRHNDYHAWKKIHYDESDPSRYWLLFQREKEGSIETSWEKIVKIGFAGFALFMLIGFGVLALIVTITLRPLTEVADAMKRLEDGDLSARADVKSRTEIGKITHAFNSMADWLEKYRSELQKSLAITSAMSDTAPNAHIIIKQDGKIVSANRATERIFGYSIDELTGKDIKTLMPKPYNEKEEDYVWDNLDIGIDRVVGFGMKELNAMRNGGEVFRVSVYLGKAKIAKEAVFIAVINDISEHKRSKTALLENEEKYRSLFTNANDAIYLIDPVTAKIVDCNQKAANMVGYDVDKLKTMTVLDLHPEDERDLLPGIFLEVMDKGAVTDISDLHHKRKDGSIVPIEINASTIEISGKRFNLSVVRDITERKRAEGELRASEESYRNLFELSPDAIIVHCEGKIVDVNSTAVKLLKAEAPQQLIGRTALDIAHPDEREFAKKRIKKVIQEKKPIPVMETKILGLDGSVIHAEVSATPVNYRGRLAVQAIIRDITERKRADKVVNNIAKGVSAETGEEFFRSLVRYLAENLDASYAFIGELAGENRDSINTIAVYANGEIQNNFEYALAGTPCINVVGQVSCVYSENVQKEFPEDRLLVEMGVESYIGTPLFDSGGNALGLLVVMDRKPLQNRTLTGSMLQIFAARVSAELERKLAEDELRTSEERFRSLTDAALDGIVIARDGIIIDANTTFVNIFGYSRSEIIGKTAMDLTAPESREIVKKNISREFEMPYEATGIRKDGSKFPFEVRGKSITYMGKPARVSSIRDITQRKRAEEALAKNREQLTKTLDSLLDAVLIIDADTVVINNCNPAASKIFGYDREEMIGRTTTFLHVDEDALENFRKHLYPAIEEKGVLDSLEFRMKRKNGEIFLTEHSVIPLEDEKGKRVSWISVIRDITERKRAEDELIASEAKYRTLMDNASDAIGICAIDGTILEVNGQMEKLTRYSKEELKGRNFQTLLPKSVAEKASNSFKNVIAKGTGSLFEGAVTRKDGVEVPVEVTSSTVEYEGRQVMQSSIRDITERKRTEQQLRLMGEITKNMSEGVVLMRASNGTIIYANPKYEEMAGYGPGEMNRMHIAVLNASSEISTDDFYSEISDDLNQKGRWEGAVHNVRKDGTNFWGYYHVSTFKHHEHGDVWLGVCSDITERKRAEEALIEAKMTAEKANEAKTRFVAKTNHELRNPLTSMMSMLKLIVSGKCESREQEKEFLKNVYNSSVHLRGLIEHLLDLSVIESGKLKMNMRSVRIDDLLELVRQITWIQAKEKGLELTFTCDCEEDKDNRMIYCEPDRLRELLVNLVNNAIKFTEKGSVRVACRVPDKEKMKTLEIIDTGIGIEPDKLKEVFKPFVQADGNLHGGAGLGLTLAKKLVLAMGGSISIESKGLGHGVKVTLSLPQAPDENKKKKKAVS